MQNIDNASQGTFKKISMRFIVCTLLLTQNLAFSALLATNTQQIQAFAGALYGITVGTTMLNAVNADITASGGLNNALNSYYASSFGAKTTTQVADTIVTNLGLTAGAAEAKAYITATLNTAPVSGRGAAVMDIVNLFSGLASDTTSIYKEAATTWNVRVDAAVAYSGTSDIALSTLNNASSSNGQVNTPPPPPPALLTCSGILSM